MLEMFLASTVLKSLASVAGAAVGLTVLWNAGDYTGVRPVIKKEFLTIAEQMDQANKTLTLIQFQMLHAKLLQNGKLDFVEQQQYCALAQSLGYVQIPICGF